MASIAFGFASVVSGAVFYVDPATGTMSGDGSSSNPWSTLQEVFENGLIETRVYPSYATINSGAPVKAGDTIRLRTGYHGILNYLNAHNTQAITIEADTGHTPRLSGVVMGGMSKWIIRGLTISPSFDMPLGGGNIVRLSNHDVHGPTSEITIENCTIYTIADPSGMSASERDALVSTGIRFMGLSDIVVRNNTLSVVNDGIVCHGSNIVVTGNSINEFQTDGISSGGTNLTITNNTIRNLYEVNVENHCDGIQLFSTDGSIVEHVTIAGNRIIQYDRNRTDPYTGNLQGIGCFGGPYGDFHVVNNVVITDMYHGITLMDTQYDCSIINNTIVDIIPGNDLTPYITVKDNVSTAQDCIVRNNISAFYAYPDRPSIILDHNVVIDDQQQMFADVASYNVQLRAGSPAVDAGTSLGAPSTDIAGTSRPRGNAVDAGAYESPYTADTTSPPGITSVTISPSSGTIGVGGQVVVTVTAQDNESGLTASNASLNGKSIPLTGQGNGTYTGTYTVSEGDPDGTNVNATGITLTGASGTSASVSSSGSTLRIDAHSPAISSVSLIPSSGVLYPGDPITIRVQSAGSESGLSCSNATLLGHQVPLIDVGGGVYEGSYTITSTDKAQEYAANLVFADSFESGDTSGWNVSTGDITVSNTAKIAAKGLEYTIRSPQTATMYRNLGSAYDETYTSFYLRIGTTFSMPENETMYLNFAKGGNGGAWATRLRNRNGSYQVIVTLGGHVIDVGDWTTIQRGQWYWIKIHYRSGSNGVAQWWLNNTSRGTYSGDTSGSSFDMMYAYYLGGFDESVYGAIHCDHFQVSTSDHPEPSIIEASGVILYDSAGNTSMSAATSGSSLSIVQAVSAPGIASVVLSPRNRAVKAGDRITITVTAANQEEHLTPSTATVNGKPVILVEQENGVYSGIYVVSADDQTGTVLEATGITLSNADGASAAAASVNSGLRVDNDPPQIASAGLAPNAGIVGLNGTVIITVQATGSEAGLNVDALFNGIEVAFDDIGGGIYKGEYTVASDHNPASNVECVEIVLTDSAGNTSSSYATTNSALEIDPSSVAVEEDMPMAAMLTQNYPNPFNATTTIPFTVPADADHVTITIYNVAGQRVRQLIDHSISPGRQSVLWDGCDDMGMVVSAGFYLVEYRTGTFRDIKRMVFLK